MRASRSSPRTPAAVASTVRFTLPYLPAREVFLAGSFNAWNPRDIALRESDEHGWAVEVALAPGCHEYRFIVDGIWVADPNNPRTAPNPFGGRNSLIYIQTKPASSTGKRRSPSLSP
jgi:1,4-alpha-glucan branching enzyme